MRPSWCGLEPRNQGRSRRATSDISDFAPVMVPDQCPERIDLSTGRQLSIDAPTAEAVHRFLSPAFTLITRSRLALTGKPCLPYKPRDFEQPATLETGPFGAWMASAPRCHCDRDRETRS